MKHGNIAIFIPHMGCKNMCSFCNQNTITSVSKAPSPQDVEDIINNALSLTENDTTNMEIAFFGGNFTQIPLAYMEDILKVAYKYVKDGFFKGIRISTRPDAIDDDILLLLKSYGVTSIELGAQSMNDNVLRCNDRGHTCEDVENASFLIKKHGFSLGLQMMTGLYMSNDALDKESAEKIIALAPDTIRIYPTVTLKNTRLALLAKEGEYIPPSLDDTVALCAVLIKMFQKHNINVIRVGLHSSNDVEQGYIGGGYHPSLKELAESKIMLDDAVRMLQNEPKGEITFLIRSKDYSRFVGQKKKNINHFKSMGYEISIKEDNSLLKYELRIEHGTKIT